MLKSLAGGALFGEVWGTEPPEVLVLHGWGRTHADFAAVVGPGCPGRPLASLAPDLPGFGSSPAPPTAVGRGRLRVGPRSPSSRRPAGRPRRWSSSATPAAAASPWPWPPARPDLVRALVLTGAPVVPPPGPAPAAGRPATGWPGALHRLGLVSEARMERARQPLRVGRLPGGRRGHARRLRPAGERAYDDELAAHRAARSSCLGRRRRRGAAGGGPTAAWPARAGGHAHALPGRRPPDPAHRRPASSGRPSSGPWPGRDGPAAVPPCRRLRSLARSVLAGIRWLRVAQREHYLPGAASRFAAALVDAGPPSAWRRPGRRWSACRPGLAVAGHRLGHRRWWWRPVRPASDCGVGRSPLAWTRRAADPGRRLARPRRRRPWRRRCRRRASDRVVAAAAGRRRPRPRRPGVLPSPARSSERRPAAMSPRPAASAAGGPDRGGHHRLLREDRHQGIRRPPGGRFEDGRGQPGQLQQPGRPGPGGQREPGRRAPRSSWPRWAPTARARSPSSAPGSSPTSP